MQPVQLSLLPDQVPAPLPELIGQLPGPPAAAITLLAGLIVRAHAAAAAEAGDE